MSHHFKNYIVRSVLLGAVLSWGLGGVRGKAIAQTASPTTPPSEEIISPPPSEEIISPPPGIEDTTSPNPGNLVPLDDATQPDPANLSPLTPTGRAITIKTPTFIGTPNQIVEQLETYQSNPYATYLGLNFYGELATADQISQTLQKLAKKTGTNPALVYVLSTQKGLKLVLVLPAQTAAPTSSIFSPLDLLRVASKEPFKLLGQTPPPDSSTPPTLITFAVPEATPSALKRTVKTFRNQISDPQKTNSTSYQASAKQLYDWILAPLKPTLEAQKIDTLIFSLDKGLRSMPIAAMYDGTQFLVEQYNLALIPSFSLTDTRFQEIRGTKMLGMGISQSAGGLPPLPSVSVEVPTLTEKIWQGTGYLNQDVTLEQFQSLAQREQYSIIHLATHAEFNPGNLDESFIQLWNGKLTLSSLRKVALNQKWSTTPTLEMLVLSACQTALGSDQAELGFSGLAVQTGVKTALGSLWAVSDEGTLGLMSEFYRNLKTAPIRAAALRSAQVSLLKGQVTVTKDQIQFPDGSKVTLPAAATRQDNINLIHPYYWAPYTVVGNWN
jgi:CHAT domain-containing protein